MCWFPKVAKTIQSIFVATCRVGWVENTGEYRPWTDQTKFTHWHILLKGEKFWKKFYNCENKLLTLQS